MFENFINASLTGDTEVATFYRAPFSDRLEPAYQAWIALDPQANRDAPASPLAMPEYQPPSEEQAGDLIERAEEKFATGEAANGYSDTYTASTLFLAAALFFAAISERFDYRRARLALLGLACMGLIAGVAVSVAQPVTLG